MKCYKHDKSDAQYRCLNCGRPICKECSINYKDQIICDECYKELINNENKQKINLSKKEEYTSEARVHYSSFMIFITSFIPGAAHMYMGLMNKGIQLLALFALCIALGGEIDFLILGAGAVIIWFYSFFDAHHVKKKIFMGIKVQDENVLNIDMNFVRSLNKKKVGLGLVIFGGYVLLKNILSIIRRIFDFNFLYTLTYSIEKSIIPILLIVLGLLFIKRAKTDIDSFDE
ncbi:B-box zinc finger protein [Abyssisolibacter fermentans]|uniref:B-box zinc finger protein n=1 Tax=Abyssisolibacter fermentans TaxID=1766203 RepID=UPI00082B0C74|nr:B-box zinc finger protein [Abyssisolibacter fermentans]